MLGDNSNVCTVFELLDAEPCVVVVTRNGGSPCVVRIYAEAPMSNDATLSDLKASDGSLSPSFSPNTTEYTLRVDESATSVTLTATPNHNTAYVKGAGEKTLVEGDNIFEIVVTAQDGTQQTYTITVVRGTINVICDVQFNGVEANKTYTGDTDDYVEGDNPVVTIIPGGGSNNMEIRPGEAAGNHCDWLPGGLRYNNGANAMEIEFKEPLAKLIVYGASGSGGTDVGMVVQVLKASDREDKLYEEEVKLGTTGVRTGCKIEVEDISEPCIVRITRTGATLYVMRIYAEGYPPVLSDDATLSNLTVSTGELWPAFNPSITHYTVEVDNNVNSITLAATANDAGAKVAGPGEKTLNDGDNIFDIVVTAVDGTVKTYTVRVKKIIVVSMSFEVTFDPNTGELPEGTSNPVDVTRGSEIGGLPVPFKTGYTFNGWNLQPDGSGEFLTETSIYDFDNDIVLYAQWVASTYILRFITQIANIPNPPDQTVTYGEEVGSLPEIYREGDNFLGWNTELRGGGVMFTEETVYDKPGNMMLYAAWSSLITSVGEYEWSDLIIYPNPATDMVTISGLEGGEMITFFDVSGRQLIHTKTANAMENISVNDLPKGTYIVKIAKGTAEISFKIMIQ